MGTKLLGQMVSPLLFGPLAEISLSPRCWVFLRNFTRKVDLLEVLMPSSLFWFLKNRMSRISRTQDLLV